MVVHLKAIGILFMVLALLHAILPRYFNWKTELRSLSLMNRQMFQVHTFFIALTVYLMGLLCFSSADDLIATSLGKRICLGFALFWSIRMVLQFFGYSSRIWRGKTFETIIHIIASIFWIYLSVIFWMIVFTQQV